MEMAMELFKPFAIRYLLKNELVNNYREAVMAYENESGIYKIAIKNVAKERLVMMNRAPTLHRYGVMAFKPVLHSGRYIGVHPLVCDPFGADFDGDTVCIMVPLQNKALTEARDILMPSCNLISQATGDILMNFSHEALSGLYHMTDIKGDSGVTASSIGEIIHLYHIGVLSVNTGVTLRTGSESVLTCAGRAMIEEVTKVPVTAGYSKGYSKKYLKEIFLSNTRENSVKIIDVMTKWAFEYSTKMGLSVCYEDCYYEVDRKDSFFDKGYEYEKEVNGNDNFDDSRKHELIIRNWVGLIDEMKHDFIKQNPDNSLVVMMKSGSRLSDVQFLQISVTKGIFSNAKGETSKTPIKNSYYEGLTGLEYFSTCSSAHKAMADKKLVTPKAGYMTRQLVNSNKEMLIVEEDCGSTDYVWTDKLGLNNREIMETGEGMYLGKYLVRSPITCKSVRGGICVKCYGGDPNTQKPIRINERVGIIAAHSVSESGTQLSMKSKHTAGAVESVDKDQMLTAPEDGVVKIESQEHHYELFINDKKYVMLKMNSNILVSDGDKVKCGQAIAELTEENIKTSSGEIVKLANLFNLYKSDYCITSFSQGEVSFIVDRSSISVLVGGVLQDKTSSMILAHEGQMMNIGDRLTVGAFNPRKFFDKTKDVKLTGQLWVDNMFDIYKYFGKSLRKIHFETIYRSMTDIVMIDKETRGLKSRGQHGDQLLLGAIQSVRAYPSWLKSISLGWAYDRMTKAVYNMESSVNCETEQVIMGTTVNSVLTHDSEGRL
jgi:DNA-directed RNA polymerase subunit beta'